MRKCIIIVMAIIFGLMFCANGPDKKKSPEKKIKGKQVEATVTGLVMYTIEGKKSVKIEVEKEDSDEYYFVVMDEKGKELLEQVDNIVTASGLVTEDIVKKKLFTVKSWKLVKSALEDPVGSGTNNTSAEEDS